MLSPEERKRSKKVRNLASLRTSSWLDFNEQTFWTPPGRPEQQVMSDSPAPSDSLRMMDALGGVTTVELGITSFKIMLNDLPLPTFTLSVWFRPVQNRGGRHTKGCRIHTAAASKVMYHEAFQQRQGC
jgi:hypothetical protein